MQTDSCVASSGLSPTQYQYTGQYSHTADFGLMFYNARWYDPALGRFAQADSIVPPGVQGVDRYAYVNNNPMRFTDPTGHSVDCGIGESYCEAGKLNVKKRSKDVAKKYYHLAEHGTTMNWAGLSHGDKVAQSILSEGGWSEGSYNDLVSHGGVSNADTLHDPATYVVAAVIGIGGYHALVTYATINADAAIVSIGSYKLYRKSGYTYFKLPDNVYTALSKIGIGQYNLANLVNRGVISSQITLGKPAIVNLVDITKPGRGTVMELKMYENAGYITGTGNFLNSDFLLQIGTWLKK